MTKSELFCFVDPFNIEEWYFQKKEQVMVAAVCFQFSKNKMRKTRKKALAIDQSCRENWRIYNTCY